MNDYEKVFYYVKDNIIYTSDTEDGTYKQRFKIMEVENTSFKLFDYKYNKEYSMYKGYYLYKIECDFMKTEEFNNNKQRYYKL